MRTRHSEKASRPEDCPTAWFAVLERARIDGDERREREAVEQLRRLGVEVHFAGASNAEQGGRP